MIELARGNLLTSDTEALVNTVNCVGVMGKGIALQFKWAYPENYREYQAACKAGSVEPGKMLVTATGRLGNPRYIVNFPTKRHWKGNSRIEDIASGLDALVAEIKRLDIGSIAVPPLGCGNGGLNWSQVRPLIEAAFSQIASVRVLLFEPESAPDAEGVVVATPRPAMTRGRALLLRLLEIFQLPGYRVSKLEVQKLAYFAQVAGEPLRLDYRQDRFGPYAENLNHALQNIEGHFIKGYGDRSNRDAQIYPLPEALAEAREFLSSAEDASQRLQRVGQLIEGFDNPHGMELLASVHWVATHDPAAACDPDQAVALVHAWSERKRATFKADHIRLAWTRLQEQGWLTQATPIEDTSTAEVKKVHV